MAEFLWPRVVIERGALRLLGTEVPRFGSRALIVTDRQLAKTDGIREARRLVESTGIATHVFADLGSQPTVAMAAAGATVARRKAIDVVVGIGGGSSMDVAKLIAAGSGDPGVLDPQVWARPCGLVEVDAPRSQGLPLILVPTTAATGSETNAAASLTGPDARKRLIVLPQCLPSLALIDPALTVTLPIGRTVEGSFESLCRLMSPYVYDEHERAFQDLLAHALGRVVVQATDRLRDVPTDVDARLGLACAATSAMAGWANSGRPPESFRLWYLAGAVGTVASVSNGRSYGALLPAFVSSLTPSASRSLTLGSAKRLKYFTEALGLLPDATCRDQPTAVLAAYLKLLKEWSLPSSLRALGLGEPDVVALARDTHDLWTGPRALGAASVEDLASFYRAALEPPAEVS